MPATQTLTATQIAAVEAYIAEHAGLKSIKSVMELPRQPRARRVAIRCHSGRTAYVTVTATGKVTS